MKFEKLPESEIQRPIGWIWVCGKCIEQGKKNIKFRAELLTYSKSFFDSLDLLFNTQAGEYWIQAKRLGYLLWRIKDRYKIRKQWIWSGHHRKSVKLTSICSHWALIPKCRFQLNQFKTKVDYLNKTPKSKASEMEHAIRWHIKVNLEKRPDTLQSFKDRLEMILNSYKMENWEEIVKQLTGTKRWNGRRTKGGNRRNLQCWSTILWFMKGTTNQSEEEIHKVKELSFLILKERAEINNFWSDKAQQKEKNRRNDWRWNSFKSGRIQKANELATELMKLAKNREADLRWNELEFMRPLKIEIGRMKLRALILPLKNRKTKTVSIFIERNGSVKVLCTYICKWRESRSSRKIKGVSDIFENCYERIKIMAR